MTQTNYESGKAFEREIHESLKRFGKSQGDFWWHRFKDADAFGAKTGRQRHEVPADHIACYLGRLFLIEEKSSRADLHWAMKYLKPHQRAELTACALAGGVGVVIIAKRNFDGLTEAAWAVPIREINRRHEAGIGRILWEEMKGAAVPLKKVAGRKHFVFDLGPFFRQEDVRFK